MTNNNSTFEAEIETYSKNLNEFTSKINRLLNTFDDEFVDDINQYIEPRKNILEIVGFYDLILKSKETCVSTKSKIDNLNNKDVTLQIENVDDSDLKIDYETLGDCANKLNRYMEVGMVGQIIEDITNINKNIMTIISDTVLEEMKRMPKVVKLADKYAKFILKNSGTGDFINNYINLVLERMGFADVKTNFNIIIQRTKNLSKHLNMVINYNNTMLGTNITKSINDGIIKHMILEINDIILASLQKIKVESKPEHIPFLINLYYNLRHGEDVTLIDEIEDLFVFRNDILALIFNCFIQLYADVDSILSPNAKLQCESEIAMLYKILTEFETHQEVKRAWVERYGKSFGVEGVQSLNNNFIEKLSRKLFKISENIPIEQRCVYILNNISQFKDLTSIDKNLNITTIIYKNCETIVGLWNIELNAKGSNLYSKILDLIKKSQDFKLHEENRIFIISKLETIVEELLTENNLLDRKIEIFRKLNNLYL